MEMSILYFVMRILYARETNNSSKCSQLVYLECSTSMKQCKHGSGSAPFVPELFLIIGQLDLVISTYMSSLC